jgi:hypothetical protein
MSRPEHGRALVVLGLLALLRQGCPAPAAVPAWEAGVPLPLDWASLQGERLRLLPGVGPVLAERLEQARTQAGGVLDAAVAARVPGIGPSLLARWAALGLAVESGLR